jgi:hypothetical protein
MIVRGSMAVEHAVQQYSVPATSRDSLTHWYGHARFVAAKLHNNAHL